MPELPEVETVRKAIAPHASGRRVLSVVLRNGDLRHPVPQELLTELPGRRVEEVTRRGKYLLLSCGDRTLIIHLGMTGFLGVVPALSPPGKHDHLDILLENGVLLRFNDPRRFGLVLWHQGDPLNHPLLASIGPEPLGRSFTGETLRSRSRGRKVAIKQFIMDSRIVAGIGNIYASESLFRAGIHPERAVGTLTAAEWDRLAEAVRITLEDAIADGSTVRTFRVEETSPAYFTVRLAVYDRAGEPCTRCGTPLSLSRLGGRSTYFCTNCQH